MVLTEKHLETIKEIALPIDHGSITIHINAEAKNLDIDSLNKLRIDKEPTIPENKKNK